MPDYQVKNIEPVAISADIQVFAFTLAYLNVIPWRFHNTNTDRYFVLQGELTIETRSPNGRRVLKAGERFQILPQTPHRISNGSTSDCQFLVVRGVVKRDWHNADASADGLERENLALRDEVAGLALGVSILRDRLRNGGEG